MLHFSVKVRSNEYIRRTSSGQAQAQDGTTALACLLASVNMIRLRVIYEKLAFGERLFCSMFHIPHATMHVSTFGQPYDATLCAVSA